MDIERAIDELEVSIVEARLPYGWWGAYDSTNHRILILPELAWVQRRSVIAHELGHAYYRHPGTSVKQERQASHWACRRLIDQSDFIDALRISDDVQGVAHILEVLPRDIRNYLNTLNSVEQSLLHHLFRPENSTNLRSQYVRRTTAIHPTPDRPIKPNDIGDEKAG